MKLPRSKRGSSKKTAPLLMQSNLDINRKKSKKPNADTQGQAAI